MNFCSPGCVDRCNFFGSPARSLGPDGLSLFFPLCPVPRASFLPARLFFSGAPKLRNQQNGAGEQACWAIVRCHYRGQGPLTEA